MWFTDSFSAERLLNFPVFYCFVQRYLRNIRNIAISTVATAADVVVLVVVVRCCGYCKF